MGRRKKPTRTLKTGTIYFVDRRVKTLVLMREVLSRQHSLNYGVQNIINIKLPNTSENATLMVSSCHTFFGKSYVKVLFACSDQSVLLGFLLVSELKKTVKGELDWIEVKKEN